MKKIKLRNRLKLSMIKRKEKVKMEERIKLKSRGFNYYPEIKETPYGFAGWAYSEMEWSDFETKVPPLEEQHWPRSERIPVVGESRIVLVTSPFDEKCGNTFYIEFVPPLALFNGYESAEELRDSAIVQCKFERILSADEYCAWIEVKILKVILLSELPEIYPPSQTNCEIEEFDGIRSKDIYIDFMDDTWKIMSWSGQGDLGEYKTFYTDTNGVRHLVRLDYWVGGEHAIFFGNIVQTETW